MTAGLDERWRDVDRHARAGDPAAIELRLRMIERGECGDAAVMRAWQTLCDLRCISKYAKQDIDEWRKKHKLRVRLATLVRYMAKSWVFGHCLSIAERKKLGVLRRKSDGPISYAVNVTCDRMPGGRKLSGNEYWKDSATVPIKVLRLWAIECGFVSPKYLGGRAAEYFFHDLNVAWIEQHGKRATIRPRKKRKKARR